MLIAETMGGYSLEGLRCGVLMEGYGVGCTWEEGKVMRSLHFEHNKETGLS